MGAYKKWSFYAGVSLILLAILTSALCSTSQAEITERSYFYYTYGAGLVMIVLMATLTSFFSMLFDGVINARGLVWPRAVFVALCALLFSLPLSIWGFMGENLVVDYRVVFPSMIVSVLLTWYGFSLIFGSFFLGKGAAMFFYNPFLWLVNILKRH